MWYMKPSKDILISSVVWADSCRLTLHWTGFREQRLLNGPRHAKKSLKVPKGLGHGHMDAEKG